MKDNLVNESGGLVNDCISRQAAIDALDIGCELLRRVLDDTDVVGVERAKYEWGLGLIESYIADIKELPSAQPQRWIPVSEKPPKEDTEVLTYDSSFGITFDSLHRGKWRKHPVAWMEKPEPPKDGGDE